MSRVRVALDLAILFAAAACYLREGFAGMFEALAVGSVVLAAVEMAAACAVAGDLRRRQLEETSDDDE